MPKTNGYQSLHTTVIGPNGTPIEYQIRTEEMNRIAEYGILTHWLFNDDGASATEIQQRTTAWLQSLLEIQQHSADSSEFIENIKIDLFPDRIYVFTPKSKNYFSSETLHSDRLRLSDSYRRRQSRAFLPRERRTQLSHPGTE